MPESVIYMAINPEYNSIRYWARNAADAQRMEKETGCKATRYVAEPAAVAGPNASLGEIVRIACQIPGSSAPETGRLYAQLAAVLTAAPTTQAAPSKPYCYADCQAYTAGIEGELAALRKKVATYEARDALGLLPPASRQGRAFARHQLRAEVVGITHPAGKIKLKMLDGAEVPQELWAGMKVEVRYTPPLERES